MAIKILVQYRKITEISQLVSIYVGHSGNLGGRVSWNELYQYLTFGIIILLTWIS